MPLRKLNDPAFRLLTVAATGTLTLQGLTLRGGNSLSGGGGIYNIGTVTLTNCTLAHNTVNLASGGGGINNFGTLTLTNSTLAYNTAGSGGGIENSFGSGGTVTLTNSTLTDNTADSGGAIFNSDDGTVTLTNSTLAYNTANFGHGGGIANSGTVTLTNSTLTDNTARLLGGGIFNFGSLTLTNCTLTRNTATLLDGGGLNNFGGILTLTNCTLVYNTASSGGGIFNNGSLTLTNSTLAYNTAGRGGGLHNMATGTLTNSTLAYNTANSGGGISSPPSSTTLQHTLLQNTILALNTTPDASPQANDCVGAVTSLGNNLIGAPTECPIILQASDLEGDPGLAAFADDGTPGNGHFPLVPASQAINKGNDAACLPTDQLGQPRVDQCDIGAIEFQLSDTTPPMVTIVSVTPDTLWPPTGKLVSVTIVATITDAGSGVDPSTTAYAVEDEYGSVEPSGSLTLGQDGRYTATIYLQASRHGNDRDGRQYTIIVSAQDEEGNMGSAFTHVIVPHDQGH